MSFFSHLIDFWLNHPALLYGIAFFLGISSHFEEPILLIFTCLCLWTPFFVRSFRHLDHLKHLGLSMLVFLTGWLYFPMLYSFPQLPDQGIVGKACIHIKSLHLQHSLFGKRWIYQCELQQFFPEHSSNPLFFSLPCKIIIPMGKSRPPANQDYVLSGKLIQTKQGQYILRVFWKHPWSAVPGSKSWAESRYQCKKNVAKWIESHFQHSSSQAFLAGLATGEFHDYWMKQQFARFGLQHLLAISGFHFAIIANFLNMIFRLFFRRSLQILFLFLCLAIYGIFLGAQPSILRAWIMCSLTLGGSLIEKHPTSLNLLGCALLGILGYDPLLSQEIGFQLSFAITGAILLFYPLMQTWINHLFVKRSLSEVLKMNHWNQYGYCILAFLQKGLALTLAVNIFALPMTLYAFHQFPWMGLLYNLFFPFLATISLCLLILGGCLFFLPPLASFLHSLNDFYTHYLLQLTYQIPNELDVYLKCESFFPGWLILYLCTASLFGMIRYQTIFPQTQEKKLLLI